jgi:ABC-type amino acid transport substrate-binding protein
MPYILLLITMAFASSSQAEVYTVAVTDEYADLYASQGDRLDDRFDCPLTAAGIEYEVVRRPLARILYELNRGTIDIGFPFVADKARDRFATRTHPVISSRYFFVMDGQATLDLDDPEQRVAFVRGFSGYSTIEHRLVGGMEISSLAQGITLLSVGRVDAVLTTEQLYRHHPAHLTNRLKARPAGKINAGYYVDDDHPKLVAALNEGIEQCRGLSLSRR